MLCDYFECKEIIADYEIQRKDGMKFCEKHIKELENCFDSDNPALRVLGFWIKAQGGPKRAAYRTLHGKNMS